MVRATIGMAPVITLLGVILLGVTGCYGFLDGRVPAHPQRPLLRVDPYTTERGAVQVETGLVYDRHDFVGTPTTVRYGLSESSEAFATIQPYQRVYFGDDHESGFGDTVVGTRIRCLEESEILPAAAVQIGGKLPTADEREGLGNEEIDLFIAGTAARTFENELEIGAFGQARWLGDEAGGDPDLGLDATVYGSQPLTDQFSVFGEFGGRFVPTQDLDQWFTTWGLRFAVNPGVILDAGGVLGLSDEAPDFQFMAGVTVLFGSHYMQESPPK
ncbi:MAG: transporter [Planctomycetota bacterium]